MADELWTIDDVAAFLGVKAASARGTLSRWGIKAHSFRPHPDSSRAQALYDPHQVRGAYAGRPGQGARTDRADEK